MTENAIALTIRGMIKTDPVIFNLPEEVHPLYRIYSFQVSDSEKQGQSWFYVDDCQGNRHRIIVEEA